MKLFLAGAMNNNNVKLVLETSPFAMEVVGSKDAKVDVGQFVFPLTMIDGDIILDGEGTVRLTPTDRIAGARFIDSANRARSPLVFSIRDNTPTDNNVFLAVQDPSGHFPGQMRLRANYSGQLALLDASGEDVLKVCEAAADTPRIENHSDGMSIRFTFGRFLLDPGHTQDEVIAWLSAVERRIDTQDARDIESVIARVVRLADLLTQEQISRDEFAEFTRASLLGLFDAEPVKNATENEDREEINARLDLAEYQRIWLAVFNDNMPDQLDPRPLIERMNRLRWEIDGLPRDAAALTTLTARMHNLNFLAMGQVGNEIARAIRKQKPLPPLAESAIRQLRAQMNTEMAPMTKFAQKMGWKDLPTF